MGPNTPNRISSNSGNGSVQPGPGFEEPIGSDTSGRCYLPGVSFFYTSARLGGPLLPGYIVPGSGIPSRKQAARDGGGLPNQKEGPADKPRVIAGRSAVSDQSCGSCLCQGRGGKCWRNATGRARWPVPIHRPWGASWTRCVGLFRFPAPVEILTARPAYKGLTAPSSPHQSRFDTDRNYIFFI